MARTEIPLKEQTTESLAFRMNQLEHLVASHHHGFIGSGSQQAQIISGYLMSPDYKAKSSGWMIGANNNCEFNSGVFRGSIAIGSGNNIFKADSNGIYLGNATFAFAPFSVSMAGKIKAVNIGTASVIVATATSKAKNGANYVCDGVNDQIEINQAISALAAVASKGTVYLLEGTYIIAQNGIKMANNVSIKGLGERTILKIKDNVDNGLSVINCAASSLSISDLRIDGNKANNAGIYSHFGIEINGSNVIAQNCIIENCKSYGVYLISNSSKNYIINNNVNSNTEGIVIGDENGGALNNFILNNICNSNGQNGILIQYGSTKNTVVSNNISSNGHYGIQLFPNVQENIISNNVIQLNTYCGIFLYSGSEANDKTRRNVITNNVICNNQQDGIILFSGVSNIINSNFLYSNGQAANNTYSEILLKKYNSDTIYSNHNSIVGNIILCEAINKAQYGIRENSASDDYNIVTNNVVNGAVTAQISLQGTNSINANNITT